jgi:hypothetical protein
MSFVENVLVFIYTMKPKLKRRCSLSAEHPWQPRTSRSLRPLHPCRVSVMRPFIGSIAIVPYSYPEFQRKSWRSPSATEPVLRRS